MLTSFKFLKGLAVVGGTAALLLGFMVYTIRKSKDPAEFLVRWVVTILLVTGLMTLVMGVDLNYGTAFIIPLSCAIVGVCLAIVWGRHLAHLFAAPITNLISGGSQEVEAKPQYSGAKAKRMAQHYGQAVEAIQLELKKFPGDYEGEMLLAAIYAENLSDLDRCATLIQRMCNRPDCPPGHISGAFTCLADWAMRQAQDPERAREALEEISRRLPDTEYDRNARQRVAHLASVESLLDQQERRTLHLAPGIQRLGLKTAVASLAPEDATPAAEAQRLVAHIKNHPDDNEAREQLAMVYALGFHRPEMAISELEELIARPHQSSKQVAHWLHLIADMQIKDGQANSVEMATASLQRIIDLYPNLAVAENARSRMSLLQLEKRGKETTAPLTLGEYEQRMGLRTGPPQRRDERD